MTGINTHIRIDTLVLCVVRSTYKRYIIQHKRQRCFCYTHTHIRSRWEKASHGDDDDDDNDGLAQMPMKGRRRRRRRTAGVYRFLLRRIIERGPSHPSSASRQRSRNKSESPKGKKKSLCVRVIDSARVLSIYIYVYMVYELTNVFYYVTFDG